MFRNASLKQAVTAAQQHVTPESRQTAAMIDRLEARGVSLVDHFGHDLSSGV